MTDIDVNNNDLTEDEKKRKDLEKTVWTRAAEGTAIASIVLALCAIVFTPSYSVTVLAGIIAIGVGGLVIYQQEQLQDTDTLRRVQNEMRQEVNNLQNENNKLSDQLVDMEGSVGRLRDTEGKLDVIAQAQGSNVESLVSLVKENGEIQQEMIIITKAETLQQMFDIILQSDRDGDFKIGGPEAREMVLRMKADKRIIVNEDALKAKIEEGGGSISCKILVEDIVMGKHEASDEHIFSFHPEAAKQSSWF